MAPNSDALVVVLLIVAAAAFVLTVRFWGRLSGPGAGRLGSRAAALLGTQVTMLAACAAVLNADFAFYTSWHDLFGTASGAVSASVAGTAQARSAGGVVPQELVINGRGGASQCLPEPYTVHP